MNRLDWQVNNDVFVMAVRGAVGVDGVTAVPLRIRRFDKYPVIANEPSGSRPIVRIELALLRIVDAIVPVVVVPFK